MTRTDRRRGRQQPRRRARRSRLQRMGAWVPVAIVGVGAIVIVFGVILLTTVLGGGSDGQSSVDIPPRTVPTYDHTMGYEEAPLLIEEYSDFQCPFCARTAASFVPLIEQEFVADRRVKLEFQHLAFLGDESTWAAEASECANEQGRFWDYHDALFENQRGENKGAFKTDNLKRFAQELGLDMDAFNECIDSHRHEEDVKAETQEAMNRGIKSTPTFVIGDRVIPGPGSYGELKRAIEAELEKTP